MLAASGSALRSNASTARRPASAERRAALLELLAPLSSGERDALAGMLERMLAARTEGVTGAKRLCRLCERRTCSRCPVARAA